MKEYIIYTKNYFIRLAVLTGISIVASGAFFDYYFNDTKVQERAHEHRQIEDLNRQIDSLRQLIKEKQHDIKLVDIINENEVQIFRPYS